MKLLVCTRADENIMNMTLLTHPLIMKFCEKWGADFKVLNQESECKQGERKNHYRITIIKELLNEYDRVLCVDSDLVINKTCPNIFDMVPYESIGTIYEDKGSRVEERCRRIQEIQRVHGNVGWERGYINTGVFLVSKIHKDIFNTINGKFWLGEGEDDVHIGYNIKKLGYNVFEMEYRWNHMTMFSESWNNDANRFDSYIIHYAGSGIFDNYPNKIQQIKNDINHIYG